MTDALEADLRLAFNFFDSQPKLRVAIIAGRGKAFCAGQDLKDWLMRQQQQAGPVQSTPSSTLPLEPLESVNAKVDKLKAGGFGTLSTRRSTKPIIAAVDGVCFGGGLEMVLNCDLVVASTRSTFALPEAARGVVASQGAIARLSRICGHQRATELLLLCEPISAEQAYSTFGFVNRLLPLSKPSSSSPTDSNSWEVGEKAILNLALQLAVKVAQNSPDAVQLSKLHLLAARGSSPSLADANDERSLASTPERVTRHMDEFEEGDIDLLAVKLYRSKRSRALFAGSNVQEGLRSFKEKRLPNWKDLAPIDDRTTSTGSETAPKPKL
ncbi:hypothetical protein OC846_005439 [Tilletia horrida]|uniref:3-hydroxyisobutyryl-CoA hydrolase n=1 Tax=Tilletia horrida TaxID=155126 RepID=A0AAN6GQL5_9BASI|nr:hypothetical protein OC846_005439 [Tilletia horrida]